MINMLPYDLKECFEVYKDAVARKKAGDVKDELLNIEPAMQQCYDNYKTHFHANNLEYILPAQVGQEHKEVLIDMYNSKSSLIKNFRKRFFEINRQTYNNLCPYCVVGEATTTEHILPKDIFPEFAINVLNLIPCCSQCNSLKGEEILNTNNDKLILNLYTDILPKVQFLFIDITYNHNLNFNYRLSNVNNINNQLYNLIERHFTKLGLISRYKFKAIQLFAEIKNMYIAQHFSNVAEFDIFAQNQLNAHNMNIRYYGINHWKMVLEHACASSPTFKQFILDQLGF